MIEGDIIAVVGGGLLSEAIELLAGPISHVGLATAPDQVTQALGHGIVTISLTDTLKGVKAAFCLHDSTLGAADRAKMVAWALKQVGTPYAYADLALEFLDIITRNPNWSIYGDADHAAICSQFVSLAALAVGRDFGVSPRICTPSDCYNYAVAHDWDVTTETPKP